MAGRKPKPTALKVLEGNPGKRALNKREPQPRGSLKSAPGWMTRDQKDVWDRCIRHCPPGLLKNIDESVLTMFVCAYVLHQRAVEEMSGEELVIWTPGGLAKPNPLIAVQRTQSQIMARAAAEMGFTPSSRSRVTLDPDDDEESGNAGSNPFHACT